MKIAVLSDVHSNACALDKVLDHALIKKRCERLFFLGDLLGYGAMPVETLDSFSHILDICSFIGGNHETLIARLADYFSDKAAPLFNEENVIEFKEMYRGTSTRAISTCLSNLDDLYQHKDEPGVAWYLEMIKNSDTSLTPDIKGITRAIHLSHGSEKDREICYLFSWQKAFLANDFHVRPVLDKKLLSPITFVGHTHIPMIFDLAEDWDARQSGKIVYGQPIALTDAFYVINPGSVGSPRDNDNRASYAILDTDLWTITFYRLEYDDTLAKDTMIAKHFDMDSIKLFMQSTYPNDLTNGTEEGRIDPIYLRELEERKELPGE